MALGIIWEILNITGWDNDSRDVIARYFGTQNVEGNFHHIASKTFSLGRVTSTIRHDSGGAVFVPLIISFDS